jgi:MoxR-like ATPase
MNKAEILELQELVSEIFVSENIIAYIADLVFATRNPEKYGLDEI